MVDWYLDTMASVLAKKYQEGFVLIKANVGHVVMAKQTESISSAHASIPSRVIVLETAVSRHNAAG